jgi:hypothetical protein
MTRRAGEIELNKKTIFCKKTAQQQKTIFNDAKIGSAVYKKVLSR